MSTQSVQTGETLRSGFQEDERWVRVAPAGWWRRWLATAPHDARGLRRWLFWIQWTRRKTAADRAKYAANLLLLPVFSAKGALLHVRKYGERVTREHGIGSFAQFRGIVRTQLGARLPPISYYKFQLYLPERREGIGDYFQETTQILHLLRNRLPDAPDRMVFRDKRLFENWCREHRLPTARNVLEVLGEEVLYRSDEPVPAGDLFSKPSNAGLGIGVAKWRHELVDGSSRWRGADGEVRDFAGLEAALKRQSRESGRPFVLQVCLVNHPTIGALGNGALCTLRVMTVRRYPEEASPLLMVLRIAIGDRSADNFDLGGIATPIDLQTGRCGKAIAKRGDYPLHRLSANPDHGAVIEGLELPYWREAIALAVRAHTLLQYATPVVGWDVAVLENGPALIEANGLPCPYAAQMPTGLPLGRTEYAGCVVSSLQSAFGLDRS